MEIFMIIISILLIAVVLLQSGKVEDGEQLFGGNLELVKARKERGAEKGITIFTFILGILFFTVSVIADLFA